MAKNDGGSAFPETRWDDKTRQEVQWCGMTLRDYFAAKAMQGLLSMYGVNLTFVPKMPTMAYEMADAMLKERDK